MKAYMFNILLTKSLYNFNTESETLIPSLKSIRYNKMHHEGSVIRSDSKEF